ncbi:glycosyltransferase family 4 protein [Paracoccus xiamenensis]|uniref:glycosyltransferase family 4 protein n=1 Tax=Paracoccus xiamenensis TaxID=2714901 RepID=UPI00140CE8BC|nr:glycosyltransferase family 4 protein [Paracoccus xiamenensis]NHF73085.1 glycosyltransferase family 4 protein [Paracoccus xiamenensis]
MKILMIQGGFGAGGAEKMMCSLAAHRTELGDDVHVAAMTMPAAGSFFDYPAQVHLHVLDRPAPRLPASFLQPRRGLAVRRLIAELRPDLIVSFLTKVNCLTLLAATGTGIPVIVSERNNPSAQSPRFWRRAQNTLIPRAAGIAMQTHAAAMDLPPAQAARAHVVPNHCDPVPFTPAPPADHCRFVAVGRLDAQKGFDLLLEAFARLPADLPATLDIFGKGQERDNLQAQIRALGLTGRARLAGLVPSASDWLGAGDVAVVSSRYEGFCNVVAEATCSGMPIISFDCPYGPSEMVRHEQNGLLVPNGDVAGLAKAMERLARDRELRNELAGAAWIMADRLDTGRIMAQWDALIAESLGDTRAARRPQPADSTLSS